MSGRQNEVQRCSWCQGDLLYERYHDEEWGVPVFDLLELFERLALESMQAGLSDHGIKSGTPRERFLPDPKKLALCGEAHIVDWLKDTGLIRHRGVMGVDSQCPFGFKNPLRRAHLAVRARQNCQLHPKLC